MLSSKTRIFKSDSSGIEFSKYCNENVQTEFAIQGTKMLISIYPAIPFLIGVSLLFFYEINKKMELQIESDLKARRN